MYVTYFQIKLETYIPEPTHWECSETLFSSSVNLKNHCAVDYFPINTSILFLLQLAKDAYKNVLLLCLFCGMYECVYEFVLLKKPGRSPTEL